jgi:signal transduction histidine kinase
MDEGGPHGIARRVSLLVGMGVVVPLALVGGAAGLGLKQIHAELMGERRALAASVSARVERRLRRHLASLSSLGAGRVDAADPAALRGPLRAAFVRSPDLAGVFLLGADGRLAAEDPRGLVGATLPSAAIAAARRADRPVVTDVQADGRAYLLVPLRRPDGRPDALAGAVVDPAGAAWSALLGPNPLGASGSMDLLDGRGLVMASTDPARALQRADAGSEVSAVSAVGGATWRVVLRQPRAEAFAPLLSLAGRLVMLGAAALAVALLFAWGAARSVTDPLETLSRAADRMARGAVETPIADLGDDQIGQLGRAFEAMRVALERSLASTARARDDLERRVAERTRELERLYRELRERDAVRGHLLRKVIGAQEEERRRIARELHDETCQTLAVLAMRCEAAAAGGSSAERAAALRGVRTLAGRALDEVHRVIFDLRPSMLDDLGLLPAIRWLAARHLEPLGVSARCEFGELDERLPPETETALFRAVQEALLNVARHAQAQNVLVQAARAGDALEIEIEDDGVGFDREELAAAEPGGRGLGLLGIRERMELLGGSARIDSSAGHGTRILLRAPVPAWSRPPAAAHA